MLDEHSSTNTKRSGSIEEITMTRKAALKNSSRSLAPSVLFFGRSPSSLWPGEGRFANRETGHLFQVLPSVFEIGEGTLLYVGFKEPPCLLIE